MNGEAFDGFYTYPQIININIIGLKEGDYLVDRFLWEMKITDWTEFCIFITSIAQEGHSLVFIFEPWLIKLI